MRQRQVLWLTRDPGVGLDHVARDAGVDLVTRTPGEGCLQSVEPGRLGLLVVQGEDAPALPAILRELRGKDAGHEVPVLAVLREVVPEHVAQLRALGVRRVMFRDEFEMEFATIMRAVA